MQPSAPVSHIEITNVDTTAAFAPDAAHVADGQEELAKRKLLPERQLVDSSYVGSQIVLETEGARDRACRPSEAAWHRSQLESGYDLSAFKIDWDGHFAICPQGKKSTGWWSAQSTTLVWASSPL